MKRKAVFGEKIRVLKNSSAFDKNDILDVVYSNQFSIIAYKYGDYEGHIIKHKDYVLVNGT
ncbi:hypothetical protein [Jeotgalibacillus marinus]|uniref:DUF2187 domain-containing protein n=1 Tax=Jeotgalibacillus marinus TaxID=86667 RepID=A0ABV3Q4Z1_9BACL